MNVQPGRGKKSLQNKSAFHLVVIILCEKVELIPGTVRTGIRTRNLVYQRKNTPICSTVNLPFTPVR